MKKIGIVTYHYITNNGAFLRALSLEKHALCLDFALSELEAALHSNYPNTNTRHRQELQNQSAGVLEAALS